jgi:hypothetical protein
MMTKTLVEFSTLEMNVCVRNTLVRNRKTSLPKVENLIQNNFYVFSQLLSRSPNLLGAKVSNNTS